MRHVYLLYVFWSKLLFSGLLRNFTSENPFSHGDISWHSLFLLRSFSFPCFEVKKMELHVKNVGSGPSLALGRNLIQLKQTKGHQKKGQPVAGHIFTCMHSSWDLICQQRRKYSQMLFFFGKSSDNTQLSWTWFLQAAFIKLLLVLCFSLFVQGHC